MQVKNMLIGCGTEAERNKMDLKIDIVIFQKCGLEPSTTESIVDIDF